MIFSFFEIKVAVAALATYRSNLIFSVRRKKNISQQELVLFQNLVTNKLDVQENVKCKDVELTDDELHLILYSLKLCYSEIRLSKKNDGISTRINGIIGYNVDISRYHIRSLERKLTKQLIKKL